MPKKIPSNYTVWLAEFDRTRAEGRDIVKKAIEEGRQQEMYHSLPFNRELMETFAQIGFLLSIHDVIEEWKEEAEPE